MNNDEKFDKVINEVLKKEPPFELPYDFADRVVLKIQQKAVEQEAQNDRWWMLLGILSIVGALAFVFTQVSFKLGVGVFTFLKGYAGLVIFGVLFVIVLQIIDRILFSKSRIGR